MIIKCPECGHQVSDKAPMCPSCGVEIAGHVVKCPNCGEIYLKEDEACPNCHQPIPSAHGEPERKPEPPRDVEAQAPRVESGHEEPVVTAEAEDEPVAIGAPIEEVNEEKEEETYAAASPWVTDDDTEKPKKTEDKEKKNKHISLLVAFVITTITCIVLLSIYQNVKADNEKNEFENAMQSNDPNVLQQYIELYGQKAPIKHIQEAEKKLATLQLKADNWAEVVKQNTRAAYDNYLKANPDTPHKSLILQKLDEMDWVAARAANSEDAYAQYIADHPNGKHKEEAGNLVKQLMTETEKKTEADAAKYAEPVRRLLIAMNTKSTAGIEETVAEKLNFNGASGATAKDVAQYMRDKLYQADVKNINWRMEKPTACDKVEGDDEKAAAYRLTIPAKLEINRESGKATLQYSIKATVNADNRITAISLSRQ